MDVGMCGVSCERTSRIAPVFLLWLNGACRTLATFRITFQASMSLAVFLQPLTPIIFRSFSTPSNRLPLSRLSNGSFPFWDNLKHILRSSFFWHYSHMSLIIAVFLFLVLCTVPSTLDWCKNLHTPFSLTRPSIFPNIFQSSVSQHSTSHVPPSRHHTISSVLENYFGVMVSFRVVLVSEMISEHQWIIMLFVPCINK